MKQDKFEDIDEEARQLSARRNVAAKESTVATEVVPQSAVSSISHIEAAASQTQFRGIWVAPLERYLDPSQKSLVWGAPPLDQSSVVKNK